ncbi:hypothetical protein G4V62_02410 [Bacillaceae bacterium SIJ1]|uniref:hypothetical protein n=1 Tax=Litoribacterium kuwaitense TaxID=1398745 RepID=UPI0013EB9C56|nr:hypothetical protein [Litoribacterium kuwaitense]NGP43854.1 hypothetical protein [Litoribacterium kuwaitense]
MKEHAALQIIESDGTPSVYVTTGEDFYEAVASIKNKGLYTFFCNGNAVNSPIGGRSIRGTIFVTTLTAEGVASLAEIRGQDYGGIVWANYYDTNASETWKGWSHIGGAYAVQAENQFDPFQTNPGVYETTSATNAPVQGSEVKIYTITKSYSGRRQLQCNISESGDIYFANIQTNGVFKGWRKVVFEN